MVDLNKIKKISEILEKRLGHLKNDINLVNEGACNAIFVATLQNETKFIIKTTRDDPYDFEPNSLETEYKIIKVLNSNKIENIPKVIFFDKKNNFYCYNYIPGSLVITNNNKINPIIFQKIALFHSSLHSKEMLKKFKDIKLNIDKSDIKDEILKKINILKSKKIIEENDYVYIVQLVNNMKVKLNLNKSLVHSDLHIGNVLMDNLEMGIVDFGKFEIANINKDFGHYLKDFPSQLDYIINEYEKKSENKLDRNSILLYCLDKDLQRLMYHVKRIDTNLNIVTKRVSLISKLKEN